MDDTDMADTRANTIEQTRRELLAQADKWTSPERSRAFREAATMLPDAEPESVIRYHTLVRFYALVNEASHGESDYEPTRRFVDRRFKPTGTRNNAISVQNFQADLREAVRHARTIAVDEIEERIEVTSEVIDTEDTTEERSVLRKRVADPVTGVETNVAIGGERQIEGADPTAAAVSEAKRSLAEHVVDIGVPEVNR